MANVTDNKKQLVFTPEEMDKVTHYLMGTQIRPRSSILVPQTNGMARVQPKEELQMQRVMESCPFKGVLSFVVGGAFGGFIGLFSSSIAPHHTHVQMTTRETLIDMKNTITSNAKNFAVIGLM